MSNVLLIITGGVRAPRGLEIASALKGRGHNVRVVLTQKAWLFIVPHLLKNPGSVFRFLSLWHPTFAEALGYLSHKAGHVRSVKWADLVLVAPCTANTLGRIASGLSHTFPTLVVRALARGKKVFIAPSMNPEMWEDVATQHNYELLKSSTKYRFVGPVEGVAVSGDHGMVMASAEQVVEEVGSFLEAEAEAEKSGAQLTPAATAATAQSQETTP